MRSAIPLIIFCVAASIPAVAGAHAFGMQYSLPLPVSLYIDGAIFALISSFSLLMLFGHPRENSEKEQLWKRYLHFPFGRHVVQLLIAVSMFLFVLTIATGLFGSGVVTNNVAPVLFWILFLLGFAYVCIVIDGIWEVADPIRNILPFEKESAGVDESGLFTYPLWFRYVPVLCIYYFLIWIELLSGGVGSEPLFIAAFLLGYVMLTAIGCFLFGAKAWFSYGDFFGAFFRMLGMLAPLRFEKDRIRVTVPGMRLVRESVGSVAILFFILFALASTAFDGLRETLAWWDFLQWIDPKLEHVVLVSSIALLIAPLAFFILYGVAIGLMRLFSGAKQSVVSLTLRFGYSLVPIAIAYHVAHYFGLFITNIQSLIPLASDPFGWNWNLFGTRDVSPDIGIIGPSALWHMQVIVIIVGHIIATIVAHRIAEEVFPTRRQILLSQMPMLVLMVAYTAFGLWLLSQPFAPSL